MGRSVVSKTPEQLAEEWMNEEYGDTSHWVRMGKDMSIDAFLAGYQAAMNSPEKLDSCEHILDMQKMVDVNSSSGWISVKDRLPEINTHGYSEDVLLLSQVGRIEVSNIQKVKRVVKWRGIEPVIETENGTPIEDFTHWMPLPKPPEE